jgi:hypothetical protein
MTAKKTHETVSYRAKSVAVSSTVIFNTLAAIAAILMQGDVQKVLGPRGLPWALAAYAAVNVVLRIFGSVRPVAFVAPGKTKAVAVRKL